MLALTTSCSISAMQHSQLQVSSTTGQSTQTVFTNQPKDQYGCCEPEWPGTETAQSQQCSIASCRYQVQRDRARKLYSPINLRTDMGAVNQSGQVQRHKSKTHFGRGVWMHLIKRASKHIGHVSTAAQTTGTHATNHPFVILRQVTAPRRKSTQIHKKDLG
jgi:hypothetical protein